MKPIILITNKFDPDSIPFGVGRFCSIRSNYCRAVIGAGGTPVISAMGDPAQYAQMAHGILFTGSGSDIGPSIYGREPMGALGCDPELDEMELALFREFRKLGKPIFGICRGHQLINVALGGTLIQDIPSQKPNALPHRGTSDTDNVFHKVKALPGSRMEALFGGEFQTNSYHHQAIDTLGEGLIPTAKTEDGIIEAIEHQSEPILAVQFHPERMIGEEQKNIPDMLPLLRHFVSLCK